jgi:excisionase family DNA binding protein
MADKKLMTVGEVAKRLGISRAGVYGLVFKKRIPALKISRRMLRFKEKDIGKWLESKSQAVAEDQKGSK